MTVLAYIGMFVGLVAVRMIYRHLVLFRRPKADRRPWWMVWAEFKMDWAPHLRRKQ